MASIKGLSVKKVVNYKGHEGEPLTQCDVYYKGKKVGDFAMADFGGENRVNVTKEVEELFSTYGCKPMDDGTVFYGIEWAIYDILELLDLEKAFKKGVKDQRPVLVRVCVNDWTTSLINAGAKALTQTNDEVIESMKAHFKQFKELAVDRWTIIRDISYFDKA